MSIPFKFLAALWLLVAVLRSVLSFSGGDTSIVAGWLYLIWTAPFGVVWQFCLYDIVLAWIPGRLAQPVGVLAVDLVAFAFWFLVLPKVRTRRIKRSVP